MSGEPRRAARGRLRSWILIGLSLALLPRAVTASARDARAAEPVTIQVFRDTALHFQPDSAGKFARRGETAEEKGRVVRTSATLPASFGRGRIVAMVSIRPEVKNDREVYDRYDRAGNIRLAVDDGPDVEIVRFMTAYGGPTNYEVDVTHLAPLLHGTKTFRAFIDTWVSPAWRIDFSLRSVPGDSIPTPSWATSVYYQENFNREERGGGDSATVTVPAGLERVVLRYVTTGHCTDGRDEDEFVSKANVISVDGVVVSRFHPWRTDCRRFRELNPYCARWTDGSWSSDYSRSGWCPSQVVEPVEMDLTDHLTTGTHTIRFVVENMRPKNAEGDYGYWRLSAMLVGWKRVPDLWRNR